MPLLIRTVGGVPLTTILRKLVAGGGADGQVEAWSRTDWYCPICGVAHAVMRHTRKIQQICPKCDARFWLRIVEGDTLVTSTDDPSLRPGGA